MRGGARGGGPSSPNPAPCDNPGAKMHMSVASTSLAQTCGNPGTFSDHRPSGCHSLRYFQTRCEEKSCAYCIRIRVQRHKLRRAQDECGVLKNLCNLMTRLRLFMNPTACIASEHAYLGNIHAHRFVLIGRGFAASLTVLCRELRHERTREQHLCCCLCSQRASDSVSPTSCSHRSKLRAFIALDTGLTWLTSGPTSHPLMFKYVSECRWRAMAKTPASVTAVPCAERGV